MKLNKIDEVWNSANPRFKWHFGLLSSKNFATMATRRNVFSSLLMSTIYEHSIILYYIIDDTMAEDTIVSCCTEANNSVGEECQMNR